MKILLADKFQEAYLDVLQKSGHEIELKPNLGADDLPNEIQGYECLIVRSTKVTKATIDASDELNLIIRAGAGVNTIDINEAANKGIFVCNTPGKNAIAVAELAFGLLLSIDRKIADNVSDLKNGQWNKKKYSKAEGVFGKTVGIVGLGDIGLAFAERANAFGMQVLTVAKQRDPDTEKRLEEINVEYCDSQKELLEKSDVVSLHVPANDQTKGMVNSDFISSMKENSILINTSRGTVVEDAALLDGLNNKGIWAGLDVYNDEPSGSAGDFSTEISQHSNVYGTHHIGASTEQAQNAIAEEVVEVLNKFENGVVLHSVNMQKSPEVSYTISVRHFDKVGVLANVLNQLKADDINIGHMENKIFEGAVAACATLHANKCPNEEIIKKLNEIEEVIQVSIKGR
ncbi:MAG: hypothetical protein COA79_15050 [Planctomycetota bacterium]|nr:MAG: hypothetical protein COA79_15050 [Planctomycetota bacterium]